MKKFSVREIESKDRKDPAKSAILWLQPFSKSASNRLGFSPKKTMMIAQKPLWGRAKQTRASWVRSLTWERTSLNLAKEAVAAAREHILQNYGKEYLPAKAISYTTSSKGAQEAHEAIRPTNLGFTPQIAAKFLEKDALKLYTLIYNRFLACQMSACVSQTQKRLCRKRKRRV